MIASNLRHRIKLFSKVTTRTPTGAVRVGQWQHTLTVWGRFMPLSVKDIIAGQAQSSQIVARVTIRHRTDLNPAMRVQYAGQYYEIVGEPLADPNTGKEYLTLALKGVTDDR